MTFLKQASMRSTKLIDRHPLLFAGVSTGFAALFVTLVVLALRGIA